MSVHWEGVKVKGCFLIAFSLWMAVFAYHISGRGVLARLITPSFSGDEGSVNRIFWLNGTPTYCHCDRDLFMDIALSSHHRSEALVSEISLGVPVESSC